MEQPLEDLFNEVRLLWNVIDAQGDRLHGREAVTRGMRSVLEVLRVEGPRPVPGIARHRRVSRQHAQGLVNQLRRLRLVDLSPNPDHRRSVLVRLNPAGQRTINRIREKERRSLARLVLDVKGARLTAAAATLRKVRRALQGA